MLPDFSQIRVLIVGDVMLDRYWFGDVQRISPEAPVPIVSINQGEQRAGGAANVALNVASLGAKCTLLSVTGDDQHASKLEAILAESGIDVVFLKNDAYETTVKQRVISRNQQLIRLDFEQRPASELLDKCKAQFQGLIDSADSVIFSDYGKGCLKDVSEMIACARSKNIPAAVDPKGRDYSKYTGASVITPNFSEFQQVVGDLEDDLDLDAKAVKILGQLKLDKLLITLSERGMKLYRNQGKAFHSPARAREVYDVSGAGDTVIACLGTLMASNLPDEQILEIANAAAGVVVAKLGTAVANRQEIERALTQIRQGL